MILEAEADEQKEFSLSRAFQKYSKYHKIKSKEGDKKTRFTKTCTTLSKLTNYFSKYQLLVTCVWKYL